MTVSRYNVKQYIDKYGWQMPSESGLRRAMNVDIRFINSDGLEDETEFSIEACDVNELSYLYEAFCNENQLPNNTVTNICVVEIADKLENLS